jgi:hypothetical protein
MINEIIMITMIKRRRKNNRGNHCNPINPGSDKIMIIAYRNSPSVGKRFLSPLNTEADPKNHGNHCNPINPGSDFWKASFMTLKL